MSIGIRADRKIAAVSPNGSHLNGNRNVIPPRSLLHFLIAATLPYNSEVNAQCNLLNTLQTSEIGEGIVCLDADVPDKKLLHAEADGK